MNYKYRNLNSKEANKYWWLDFRQMWVLVASQYKHEQQYK